MPKCTLYHLSRDGRVAAVTRTIAGNTNVWLLDTERGVPRRLTFDVNDNDRVILSPDGTRVVHQANGPRDGSVVYERRSDGTGGEIQLLEESVNEWHHPQDWSADGRYIVYAVTTTTGLDLRALPLSGERHRSTSRGHRLQNQRAVLARQRWVAYESNETGRLEIYVQPFPGPGPKVQVSVGGGTLPRWRRDGSELFYLAPDRRLMAVSVSQTRLASRDRSSARLVHAVDHVELRALTRRPAVSGHRGGVGGQPHHRHPQLEAAHEIRAAYFSRRGRHEQSRMERHHAPTPFGILSRPVRLGRETGLVRAVLICL